MEKKETFCILSKIDFLHFIKQKLRPLSKSVLSRHILGMAYQNLKCIGVMKCITEISMFKGHEKQMIFLNFNIAISQCIVRLIDMM